MAHTHGIATVAALLFVSLPARGQSPSLKPDTIRLVGHRYVADLTDGGHAELTLDPRLQTSTDDVLRAFQIPYAGAVVISIPDGRVLAMVGRSAVDPRLGPADLALHPWAPSASVFKVVSATALVEGGVSGATRICYHGGVSSILPDNLVDIAAIDRSCATLAYGIGKSQNAIIAKLVTTHLTAADLAREGRSFGFGETIPFEIPIEPSHLDVPANNKLEMARASAGFWHSTLSPMHGALLAATIANAGEMPAPTLIDRAVDGNGRLEQLPVAAPRHVADGAAAAEVGRMMELTTRIGTAKGTFRNKRGQRYLPIEVAGKTGTLNAETDHGPLGYSWFVGYAPADHPTIAFAVVLGNAPNWRIKATYVGRHIVTEYLNEKSERSGTHLVAAR
ncbi:MAG TPA: penicillin-binding transpeptidase domain-containing protein [Polyangia bacterium]|jgi:peptidoglycan glycosyltransferase|nr:penicillin-binding transpeptidase domain-containing protein [Polyangia bacterium]